MENIKRLLDEVKKAKGIESDYALAKALSLPKQRISDYYKGKTSPDAYACLQISKALGRSRDEIDSLVQMESEKDEVRREVWAQYYKSIQRIAAAVIMTFAFFATLIVADDAKAANNTTAYDVQIPSNTNYAFIGRYLRGLVLAVRHMLSSAFPRFCFSG
jgi:transcriptional regulator with XRE-family HTH domain